jgi:hypothetical protein
MGSPSSGSPFRRAGLSVARLSWMLGVSVREYRELVEGEAWPSYAVWERIAEFWVSCEHELHRQGVGRGRPACGPLIDIWKIS